MLDFRLQLLEDSGQIQKNTALHLKKLIAFLEDQTGLKLEESNAAMLITHFAIALERAAKKESIGPMDESACTQIQSSPFYSRAQDLLDQWLSDETLPEMPINEKDFLLLHLCVLLDTSSTKNNI